MIVIKFFFFFSLTLFFLLRVFCIFFFCCCRSSFLFFSLKFYFHFDLFRFKYQIIGTYLSTINSKLTQIYKYWLSLLIFQRFEFCSTFLFVLFRFFSLRNFNQIDPFINSGFHFIKIIFKIALLFLF